MFVLELIA